MSQENVELVSTLLSAFDRADYEAALEALDPHIEWQVPPGIAIGREVYRGRDEVQRGFAEWLAAWDTHRFEPEEILDHGDHVVVGGMQIGRGRGSGVEVRLPTFHVFTLRDGKVTRHRSYRERFKALEAAGTGGEAMSQENVDRALELLDAFNRRDLDAFVALTDDGIEVESRLVAMEGGYHGHEGLRTWWGDFLGAFPDYNLEVEELRDLGDVTLGHMRGWGHGADSATPLVDPFWIPMRWRDGKLVWWRNCSTEAEALEAVGLSE